MTRPSLVGTVLAATLGLLSVPPASRADPVDRGGGAVASDEANATVVGIAVLRAGGNAVDAAVATALALAVVHPEAGNLGGGGFAVVRMGSTVAALDFRETAPAAATPDMFLVGGIPSPERSQVGPLAAGVPGSPAGYFELHRRFGQLPWAQVVAPAVALARDGFALSERTYRSLRFSASLLARFPGSAEVWLPEGEPPPAGTLVRLPALARVLSAYAQLGPPAITAGEVAAAIEAASRRHGGVLTAADVAAYQPVWREPLRFAAFGWELASMPLPSSGGIILAQSCGLLERRRWPGYPRGGVERAHLLAEAWRRAFADRTLLGDPAATRATAEQLLAPAWLDWRAREIGRRVTPSARVRPHAVEDRRESAETTHLSVLDGEGNAVALTTTLNGAFGCGLWVAEAGFFLNNEMDDFTTAPGQPNQFGLIQGEANAVAPGRRMLSSMAPTIAWRGGEILVVGGRGGSKIPTGTLQVVLNVIVDGDTLTDAVARPRLHHQWLPDVLAVEPGALSPAVERQLRRRGHTIEPVQGTPKVNSVRRLPDGTLEAAADPRGPGAAGVVPPGDPAAQRPPRPSLSPSGEGPTPRPDPPDAGPPRRGEKTPAGVGRSLSGATPAPAAASDG
ncbi:MAG: gamma-glutamyltransferase [Acidobacteriota bacterium]|jgi:gamma-glutamyltranspeptidase/glutathione hydrolase